ncbi:multicopper oxidase domain-containing protein [Microbacterium sp. 2C]|uniref:multicopper oxidase domain-containing protein n=1 Tax=Microbacterium paulum TaxID=2707006 RepID=UPI0018C1D941|nr:multicopper oxidase domain-containing protein [Microbacterium paulum]MBG0717120.1 multicopper oxidase domain-containing protein [Microbacterium paulum]
MSRRNWYLLTNAVVFAWIVMTFVAVTIHRFVNQPLWLMVHVPLLGAATAAILIWSQHFSDTLLRRPAPAGRVGLAVRLGAHSSGAAVVIAGILSGSAPLVIVGATGVAAAIVVHAVVLFVQLRRALPSRFGPLVRYYVAAALVFLGGIAIGAVMGALADPGVTDRLVAAHIVLNAYGWIGLTALGTLVLLWPTVLHARMDDSADAAARRALPVLVAGLVVAATGPLVDLRPLVAVGMTIWLAGALLLGRAGWRHARRMPPGTFAGWSLAAAYAWAVIAAATLVVIGVLAPDWAGLRAGYLMALGPLVAGFGVQLLMGALSYLLPVVALGSPAAAEVAADVLDRGAAFRVAALNGAIALYLLPMPSLARVLLSFVALGVAIAFAVLLVRAVILGRRVRRAEGDAPDRSRVVRLQAPTVAAPPAPAPRTGAVVAAFAVLALCVGAGVAADPAAVGISIAAPAGEVIASGATTEVTVEVEGMHFTPSEIDVPYGDALVVTFHNTGADVHDLTFANGVRTPRLAPGDAATIEVGLIGADLEGWCSIAGHRQMGMELTVRVTGAPTGSATATASEGGDSDGMDMSHDHSASSGSSAADDIDLSATPADDFSAWPAALEPASDETVHRVTLTVHEIVTDVAPGISQTRWTFGGTSPGPVLRGRIGDRFEITLANDGSIGHSIDFHAGMLAPDQPMRTIQPGESLTYTFTATQAGIWMYHCSTMPMSMHIANGMFGAVIIDPPDLAPVSREYLLVQSEFYLGAQGETADADRIATQQPDLVAFNGYADQYVYRPLAASVGERVRVWTLDAGPNTASSFHVVGGQFDTVFFEGAYTLRPDDPGGSQALAMQPAQGGFVELAFAEAGNYPFVTHIMSDAEKGAKGIFHVDQ